MAADEVDEYELDKIRAEIQQEKQMKEMLDQSAKELRITVEELEKRYESIENEDGLQEDALIGRDEYRRATRYKEIDRESNEWKTRFETQEEMNQQLERQIIMLQDKVEEAKRNLKDADLVQHYQTKKVEAKAVVDGRAVSPSPGVGNRSDTPTTSKSTGITINISVSPTAGKTPREMKNFDDFSDANPSMVRGMEKEKQSLFNQLRDLEWRLDQESKAYHKANDERKQYVVEINSTKGNIEGSKARQRAAVGVQQREVDDFSKSPRLMGYAERHQKSRALNGERKNTPGIMLSSRLSTTSRVSSNVRSGTSRSRRRGSNSSSNASNSALSSRVPSLSNIPEDQRILDPKKGPIKKTAAIKSLPSLENLNSQR